MPIREDFFDGPLSHPAQVRLAGCRCGSCGEVFFGKRTACENCQSEDLTGLTLGRQGKLWSYTVIRHRPPPPYVGPEPFVPFGVGWVELPEGVRVLSALTGCDVDKLKAGMDLELVIERLCEDEEGNEIMTYRFRPVSA
ncbi:MAG: OB-fold domain-containing protein [Chloroflexota bacterium]